MAKKPKEFKLTRNEAERLLAFLEQRPAATRWNHLCPFGSSVLTEFPALRDARPVVRVHVLCKNLCEKWFVGCRPEPEGEDVCPRQCGDPVASNYAITRRVKKLLRDQGWL